MEKEVEELILNNTKLIYVVLKKYGMYNQFGIDKYYDVGMIGLVKGAKKYDKNKGLKQSSFLTKCIINEILCTLRKENSNSRLNLKNTISLTTSIHENIILEDVIKSEVDIEKEIEIKEDNSELYQALSKLTDIEKKVIIYTFGLFENDILTQDELGNKFNLRQGSISRVKLRAIKKLRRILNGRKTIYKY